jgi:hypothetical protein
VQAYYYNSLWRYIGQCGHYPCIAYVAIATRTKPYVLYPQEARSRLRIDLIVGGISFVFVASLSSVAATWLIENLGRVLHDLPRVRACMVKVHTARCVVAASSDIEMHGDETVRVNEACVIWEYLRHPAESVRLYFKH